MPRSIVFLCPLTVIAGVVIVAVSAGVLTRVASKAAASSDESMVL